MNKTLNLGGHLISWFFGLLVAAVGLINTFWGNDPGFGIFLILLAFVYFPPANVMLKEKTGFAIPLFAKLLLGVFIIMAALGVGELFDKIDLMMMDV
ncbi:hypothetical protein ACD591_03965 [Rufibacter glacialis]|uniref:Uncharacterized protein n=1 Tax=Rufibacter glacialis TaxID=1259555 RepID=A0A5M8QH21_9BACT|nr:hypothetical protein [Rufibacter glacialis]KAA6434518.1 hypothetical protein FOE74_10040 [Rufibacter glacialis]GGK70306.1 hypothetical protein GCM10011405_17980 [Rufibacter glacialis]